MFRDVAPALPARLSRIGLVALACSTALLAACGSGDRKSFFVPDRVVSFGDENSAFEADTSSTLKDASGQPSSLPGLTYTVKYADIVGPSVCPVTGTPQFCGTSSGTFTTAATTDYYTLFSSTASAVTKIEKDSGPTLQRTTTTVYQCATPTIWVQTVARAYARGYNSQCPSESYGGAISYAVAGAKSDDIVAQMSAHRGELNSKTVVTVMAGQNDILELYAAVRASSTSEPAANGELNARADRMAAAIKDVIGTGAKVVLALTPDLGESPKAYNGTDDAALLARLTRVFNDRLYVRGLGNVSGRSLAGVSTDSYTNTSTRSSSYVYRTSLCNTGAVLRPDEQSVGGADPLKYCTTQHLVSGGSLSTYMWADSTRFAPLGHSLIGVQAYTRAHDQF